MSLQKIISQLKFLFITYRILIIVSGLLLTFYVDRAIVFEISEEENAILRKWSHYITDVALGSYWIAGAVFMVVILSLLLRFQKLKSFENQLLNFRTWATHLILAILSTGSLVMLLKFMVGRERPNSESHFLHVFDIFPFNLDVLYQSFPSGHTQVIFCVSMLLTLLWPKRQPIFFIFALLIALTRVLTLKHFLSDVYVGMLIGIYGSQLSVKFWSRWISEPLPVTVDPDQLILKRGFS